jgi:hypothetical protein
MVDVSGLQRDRDIRHSLGSAEKILQRFVGRIDGFEGHLGKHRHRKSLRGAMAKIQWTHHSEALKELRQDLDRELAVLYLLVATKPR